ncbi:MAG: hypothetical protein ACM3PF_07760 [Bacteroidota bacterium]
MSARLAVIGAGPIGLEAALAASDAGFDVQVYESGSVGAQLARFGDVPLFTPFGMNSTEATRERLRRAGVSLPSEQAILGARAFVHGYLEPIARLPELRGRVRERTRVIGIAREGLVKPEAIASAGDRRRAGRPFVIRSEHPEGTSFEAADVVVDASGVVSRPLATGPGGLAARGESGLGDQVDRHLLPTEEEVRARYAGRRVLLVGSGHSAATALLAFEALARGRSRPARVVWVHRDRGEGGPFPELAEDPLPARAALVQEANRIAADGSPWLERRPEAAVLAYEPGPAWGLRVRLRSREGLVESVGVDRVYALVGYRPDTDLFRELQVHLCYASEAPMALASALLASRMADPTRAGDCLAQTTHGAETLRTTEPGFFVLGAKSYGRNPDFLMRVGYEQARELMGLLAAGFSVPVAAG